MVLYGFSWLIKRYGTSFCDIIESQRGVKQSPKLSVPSGQTVKVSGPRSSLICLSKMAMDFVAALSYLLLQSFPIDGTSISVPSSQSVSKDGAVRVSYMTIF